MKILIEIAVFTSVAAAVHAAVIGGWLREDGLPQGAGDRGLAVVTVAPASASMRARVEGWNTAPDVTLVPEEIRTPDPLLANHAMPSFLHDAAHMPDTVPAPAMPMATGVPADPDVTPPAPLPSPSAPRPRALAEGSGAGSQAGAGAIREIASRVVAPDPSDLALWGAQIRAEIERSRRDLRVRATGRALIRLSVRRDGTLEGIRILRGTGNAALDQAALAVVKSVGRFPAAPGGISQPNTQFDLPVTFSR